MPQTPPLENLNNQITVGPPSPHHKKKFWIHTWCGEWINFHWFYVFLLLTCTFAYLLSVHIPLLAFLDTWVSSSFLWCNTWLLHKKGIFFFESPLTFFYTKLWFQVTWAPIVLRYGWRVHSIICNQFDILGKLK